MANSKVHVSLDVNSIEESVKFYSTLFGTEPTKVKPGYAKFSLDNPSINLTMQEGGKRCCIGGLNHMGVVVESLEKVLEAKQRLEAAGYSTKDEMNVTCCHAVQDKIWAKDPTGYQWEVYVFKADSEQFYSSTASAETATAGACCAPKADVGETVAEEPVTAGACCAK